MLASFQATAQCSAILSRIWSSKWIGESGGLLVAAAMAATAVRLPDSVRLADRIERLQRVLYAGSLMFVAGLLLTQYNLSWIAATWAPALADERLGQEVAGLVAAGGLQAGVGYSAMLGLFFLPPRAYLAWQVRQLPAVETPNRKAHRRALEDAGLAGTWGDDARQILALLAPILSAPVLDILTISQ